MSDANSGAVQRAQIRQSARQAFKNKKWSGKSYSQLIHAYFQSEQYAKLSPRAVKLLVDLLTQYRGNNNGDLTTAWSVMQCSGWRSKDLLHKAADELETRGWIIKTKQGDRHSPTLWALTFYGIDDCRAKDGGRKFDAGVKPEPTPLHLWRMPGYAEAPLKTRKRTFKNKSAARLPGNPFPTTGKANQAQGLKVVNLTPHLSRLSDQS